MRPERITIDEVLEIFADYLEQTKTLKLWRPKIWEC